MKLWIDAQLSPGLAQWITTQFPDIEANAMVMSKDSDFVDLVNRFDPPPQVLWIRCGNTSNAQMQVILSSTLLAAVDLLHQGEQLVEISGP